MSTQVENTERRGYTPRAIVAGFQNIDFLLYSLEQLSHQPRRIAEIRLGIAHAVRSRVSDADELTNPCAKTRIEVGIDIAVDIKGAVVDRAKPPKMKLGFFVQETKLPGLHFLEVCPDELSKQSFLVGDIGVERYFPESNTEVL